MYHYAVIIEYDGSHFFGSQVQPDKPTVQGTLEQSLTQLFNEPIRVIGAGRTDTGVHAFGQVYSFSSHNKRCLRTIIKALQGLLPRTIRVREAWFVQPQFHAQHSAISREYRYLCCLNTEHPTFWNTKAWLLPSKTLSLVSIEPALNLLTGTHDFASFCAQPQDKNKTTRTLMQTSWWIEHVSLLRSLNTELLVFRFKGTGFLRRMIRMLVGSLINLGQGHLTHKEFHNFLTNPQIGQAGPPAPPEGLYFFQVEYDKNLVLERQAAT